MKMVIEAVSVQVVLEWADLEVEVRRVLVCFE